MEKFVELIQRVHNERFSVVMNKIVAEKIPVAFLSLEHINNAVKMVNNLRRQGINIIVLITLDATPPLPDLDTEFDIVQLEKCLGLKPYFKYILVYEEIGKNLSSRLAIKYFPNSQVVNVYRENTEYIYQIFMSHLKELYKVYESLIDEESKKTFCGYWLGCISNRLNDMVYSNDLHYLTNGFIPEKGAILIDGGVFDGVTSAIFSKMGYKVYAFELDKDHFEISKKVAELNNFVLENMGLGAYKHETNYISNGGNSHIDSNGAEKATITTIDSYVIENNLPSVDFIKLDVEGAELDVLKGARTTIARYKPILALSAYHKLDDFWVLMDFVKSIRPDYEFALRHYTGLIEDSPKSFDDATLKFFIALGLDPVIKNWWECCLLAR